MASDGSAAPPGASGLGSGPPAARPSGSIATVKPVASAAPAKSGEPESTVVDPSSELPFVPAKPGEPRAGDDSWDEATADQRRRILQEQSTPPPKEAPRPLRVRARLVVVEGDDEGRIFFLGEDPVSVGRGADNAVVLSDLSVSRRHVVIELVDAQWQVHDLGSGNGTFVNGEPIEGTQRLAEGDLLELGNTVLCIEGMMRRSAEGAAAPAASPPARVGSASGPVPLPLPAQPSGASPPSPLLPSSSAPVPLAREPAPPFDPKVAARLTTRNPIPALLPPRRAQPAAWWIGGAALAGILFGWSVSRIAAPPRTRRLVVPVVVPVFLPVAHPGGAPASDLPAAPTPSPEPLAPTVAPEAEAPPPPGAPPPGTSAPSPPPSADRRSGLAQRERVAAAAYKARRFAAAAQQYRDAAASFPEDAERLEQAARDVAAVGAGITRGDASTLRNPIEALRAYDQALAADARTGAVHAALLRAQIGRLAPRVAAVHLAAGHLEEARVACETAQTYGTGADPAVRRVRAVLESEAAGLVRQATAASASPEASRALLSRVLRIASPGGTWFRRAEQELQRRGVR